MGGGKQDGVFEVSSVLTMNEKSLATKERLYSEEKKTGRASGITKEVGLYLKIMEKQGETKAGSSPNLHPESPEGGEQRAEDTITW
jgi:hypothetical protein